MLKPWSKVGKLINYREGTMTLFLKTIFFILTYISPCIHIENNNGYRLWMYLPEVIFPINYCLSTCVQKWMC